MQITNLEFDGDGLLLPGTHVISEELFLKEFCSQGPGKDSDIAPRSQFYKPFLDICEWARDAGATSMVVGGSFISQKPNPRDIDLLIIFASSAEIPKSLESFYVDGVRLDIQLLAEDQSEILQAFLTLLATSRQKMPHGLVQIKFYGRAATYFRPEGTPEYFEIVKTAYLGRKYAELRSVKGVIIPIHGIRTTADWLPQFTLLASTSGWAVAPYVYGNRGATIMINESEKKEVVEGFRDWVDFVRNIYEGPISIVAHSFGTYIFTRYIRDAGDLNKPFDSVIFCGSVVSRDFDWSSYLDKCIIGNVLNTISASDEWVKFMPEGGVPILASDKLFGKAGVDGFSSPHKDLTQVKSALLQHNNIFKRDVIRGLWLPFLEVSRGAVHRRGYEQLSIRLQEERNRIPDA
jgi:pimeloyl-ACP methyl ester carboxylesterase